MDSLDMVSTHAWNETGGIKMTHNVTKLTWSSQTCDSAWFDSISAIKPFLRNYMWFVCSFGLPGNILIILLIRRMQNRGMSSNLIIYLAVFDSLAMIAKLVQRQIFFRDIMIGSFGCKVVSIPEMACAAIANWTLVFISVERYLTVCQPLYRQVLLTDLRIKLILYIKAFVLLTYAVAMNVTFQKETKCQCGTNYIRFYQYMAIPPLTNIVTPFALILIFTICVITSIKSVSKKRSKRLKSVTSLKDSRKNSQSATQEMEATLSNLMLAAALLFFIVNALYCVYTTVLFPVYMSQIPRSVTFTRYAALMISDWNHALNFYVYLIFCQGFRSNVRRALKFWLLSCNRAISCSWRGDMPVSKGPGIHISELPSSSSVV
ncbi:hypothetical protein Btru_054636 [Bulinus truncatus]|nr:hypothetical protein Btru_054636 [Bulinus truncatus]